MTDINEWNKNIYKNNDGSLFKGEELTPNDLWDKFKIKSHPKFKGSCYSHIPQRWTNDVSEMLKKIMELNKPVEIIQIKEKWCRLTVYYKAPDEIKEEVNKIIVNCIETLVSNGLHPPN